MFGFGGAGTAQVNPQKIAAAENELEMVTDLVRRLALHVFLSIIYIVSMSKSCYEKCITPKYYEGDLNKGESVCIDRCVAKYLDVNVRIGEV